MTDTGLKPSEKNKSKNASMYRAIGLAGMTARIEARDCLLLADALDAGVHLAGIAKEQKVEIEVLKDRIAELNGKIRPVQDQTTMDLWWTMMGKLFMLLIIGVIIHYGMKP